MDAAIKFPTTPKAVKATHVKLSKRMSVEQAFQAIMLNCIAHIDANTRGVAGFHDVESLHQMRIGVRRLRAALALFNEMLQLPAGLKHDLEWLTDELGAARDWDVLAESTLARVEAALPDPALVDERLASVKLAALDQANALHAAVAEAVSSPRYERFLRSLQHWVEERGWREALIPGDKTKLNMRVTAFAKAAMEQDQQRLLKRGRKLKDGADEARHRLRIAAKKSRYIAEFFGSLYPGKQVRPYVKALASLQDALGWLNDASVAQRLLKQLQDQGSAELDGSTSFVRGFLASAMQQGEADARTCWKCLASVKAPR